MAKEDDKLDSDPTAEEPESGTEDGEELSDPSIADEGAVEVIDKDGSEVELSPTNLGSMKYVHAAFLGTAILATYLSGKLLLSAWNALADWPEAVRTVPLLLQYGEDERATFMMLAGAVVGVLGVLHYYRQERVKIWAGEVANELSRVTWPDKDTVTNGTIVVVVASVIATAYVAVLDRFWGYLTMLIYHV